MRSPRVYPRFASLLSQTVARAVIDLYFRELASGGIIHPENAND